MIKINDPSMCCGCGNCANICPKKCIVMEKDKAGFLYPNIGENECIRCGKCEKVCPFLNHENKEDYGHTVYTAYAKDNVVRKAGSSGGMFGTIALELFRKNEKQAVYGAAFDDDLKLKLTCAENAAELAPLCKSKYLQSDLGDTFFKIKEKLEKGENVLFTATPCQVYALQRFLGKEYKNLISVDFVCHGVPSQNFFDKCRAYVERKKKIRIIGYQFRSKKKNGATPHYYTLRYKKRNGKIKEKTDFYFKSPFYLGFQKYITLRDSCYHCRFSYSNRCSDITIGDFHEVDKYVRGVNRFDGVSLFVVNTKKGAKLWDEIKEKLVYYPLDFTELIKNKELMTGGTTEPKTRKDFVRALQEQPFNRVAEQYLSGRKEWKKAVYYRLPKFIRNKLKRLMGL